jgi:hypothetical protein
MESSSTGASGYDVAAPASTSRAGGGALREGAASSYAEGI